MTDLIGTILNGTTGEESVTFKIVEVCKDGADVYVFAECVEYGMPRQKIHVRNINNPVQA